MILTLRQRHRRLVIALGIFLPVAFAVGIAARKPVPVLAELPAALTSPSPAYEAVTWERAGLFAKAPVQVRLLREQKTSGRFALAFSAADFVKPDLIVYWVAGNSTNTDTLPANAILLGTFSAVVLPLPEAVVTSTGTLILYSLADNEIVDVSKPFDFKNE